MKVCSKCNLNKLVSAFYRNKSKKDGVENACKECSSERDQKRKEYLIEYRKRNRDYFRLGFNKWRKENKEQFYANNALIRAIKRGRMARECCEICGKEKAEGHHFDYAKPLDVIWLCKLHHSALHRQKESFIYRY